MLPRLPPLFLVRRLLVQLVAVLLLATVGIQAGAPMADPLERSHGSAFSASTHEVALATSRRAEPARQAVAPLPLLPTITPMAAPPAAFLAPLPAARPDSTGPPLRAILRARPAPRAPPVT